MPSVPDRRRRWYLGGLSAAASLLLALSCYTFFLWMTLALPRGEDRPPLLIYGAPFLLKPGIDIDQARLQERLDRLGYHQVSGEGLAPGDYRLTPEFLDIFLHDYPEGYVRGFPARLLLEDHRIARAVSLPQEEDVFPVVLEPALLSAVQGTSRRVREWVPLGSIPAVVQDAVLAVEDHRFYRHPGVDPLAIARALWVNLKRGEVVQGGSTITQQLAKAVYYSNRRTLLRKFKEAVSALVLETKYSKEEILESYLNEIYLGQAGLVAIYGVGEAARRYFGKPVQALSIREAALLAGVIKGPNVYSPWKDRRLATQRRDLVLRRLHEEGKLSEQDLKALVGGPIELAPTHDHLAEAPYFVDYLLRRVEESSNEVLPAGARIVTTLDPVMQQVAETVLQDGLTRLETQFRFLKRKDESLQGALVALDPKTGAILAMAGGRDYRLSQFNRAVQARRQPGSLLKPFVYLAAFEAGRDAKEGVMTPATLVMDAPISFTSGTVVWSPQNYDRQFRGAVTIRRALEQSLNVPAVRVAQSVGPRRLVGLLREMGIQSPLAEDLSLALGTSEVSLLEVTAAYAALAAQGRFASPTAIRSVVLPNGGSLWNEMAQTHQAASSESAYLVTSLLQGAVERGTASRAKALGLRGGIAGKTGTTDGYRDAWFVGYTPELVIGLWVGFDSGKDLRLTGAEAALPIWIEFARRVVPPDSPAFEVPVSIVARTVDPQTGQLATSGCPQTVEEVFIEGTEPTDYCAIHGGGLWERFKRSLGL